MTRRPALVGLGLVCATALSACGGSAASTGDADPVPGRTGTATSSPPSPSATPVAAAALGPLTGLPLPDPAAANRPVVAVAVETGTGRPAPVGLDSADLTYVSFPLPGRQRLLVMFQSRDTDRVGPVADTRPVDGKLVLATGGVLEHQGGTSGLVSRLDNADLPQWSQVVHPDTFTRDAATGALYGSTAAARAATGTRPAVVGLVPFRGPDAPAAAAPGPVGVAVAGQPRLDLAFDTAAGQWAGTLGTVPVRASNVVMQEVTYAPLDLSGTSVVEGDPEVVGGGKAVVLTGARTLDGTWSKLNRQSLTNYLGADGVPVRLAPGPTVVLLVPPGTPVTR